MDLGLKGKKRHRPRRHARHRAGDCGRRWRAKAPSVAVCARNADQVAATVAELKAMADPGHRRARSTSPTARR